MEIKEKILCSFQVAVAIFEITNKDKKDSVSSENLWDLWKTERDKIFSGSVFLLD